MNRRRLDLLAAVAILTVASIACALAEDAITLELTVKVKAIFLQL